MGMAPYGLFSYAMNVDLARVGNSFSKKKDSAGHVIMPKTTSFPHPSATVFL